MIRTFISKFKHWIEPIYNSLYRFCIRLFHFLPIKRNKIVFIQSCGSGYACNLKYIAEEIIRQKLPYNLVWLVERMDTPIPAPIRKVKYNRIRAVYELATARVMINNTKALYPVRKSPGQTFIYIPHGQPGCKCAEADAVLSDRYITMSKVHSALTDVFVSMSKYHTQVLKDTFWVSEGAAIWETGFPRNDNFYRDTTLLQRRIRERLKVPQECRVVLYAPTFRDNSEVKAYNLDFHRMLAALEQNTGTKWIFFVALHSNFQWFGKPPYHFDGQVWDLSAYEDIHELLLVADACVTDYSSTGLDFSHTRRPVFLYASDIDDYEKMRGLKPMYRQLPFPLARDNDEMERNILMFNREEYVQRFEVFMKEVYGNFDDGHAAERFVERLRGIMKRRI